MILPASIDLTVHRHAPFPSQDPFVLVDEMTGVPIDLTGATITMQVHLYEGAPGDPLLTETLAVVDGPRGKYGPPGVSEAEHEALVAAAVADSQTLKSTLRLRYDIKVSGAAGLPTCIIMEGYYRVRTGVNV
jgi:hypothetical protein